MAKENQKLIDELKEKHGEIWEVDVEGVKAYFKKPSRQIQRAAARTGQNDFYKFNEVLVKNCFVGGDEQIKEDEFIDEAAAQLAELIPQKAGKIKKL